ncbi:MAG: hypothetical protein AAF004_10140 [Pseudomonadota bacterium]
MSDQPQPQATSPLDKWGVLALYIATACIAVFMALQISSASLYDGVYHPVGNDAFYHATRIIDTAGERGFYEFDNKIHVPEGSQITWPWAYDWGLGQALSVWQAANPGAHPMTFLARVPTLWLLVNLALFVALARAAGLSLPLTGAAALTYALFPMSQLIHGIGAIDHHFVEHTFVLASTLLAMRWAQAPKQNGPAIGLGIVLGIAPAFHNGMFILQLPWLIAVGLCWLKGYDFGQRATRRFAIALVISTVLVALPSQPFRSGTFDFAVLSWFHVYISVCVAVMCVFVAHDTFTMKRFWQGVGLALLLAVPILGAAAGGVAFIRGEILLLDQIEEMKSPLGHLMNPEMAPRTVQLYSSLLYLVPVFVLWFVWRMFAERDMRFIVFATSAAFGLLLLATQIRLQYFGSFALLLAVPLILQQHMPQHAQRGALCALVAFGVIAVAWQRPLKHQLLVRQNLSFDIDYQIAVDAFPTLKAQCATAPGIVLTSNNFGHPARYHSDCTVVANNFLLTAQHEDKVRELDALWAMTPEQLLDAEHEVRYVLVVMRKLFIYTDTGIRPSTMAELAGANPPLAMALAFEDDLPPNYTLLWSRAINEDVDERAVADGEAAQEDPYVDEQRDFDVVRLFRIDSAALASR